MAQNYIQVLNAIDTAPTQKYHFKILFITGMGFFTGAYDLFCISAVSKLLGRLYYFDPATGKPGKLPTQVNNIVIGVALFGTLTGQLFFGWLGDKIGRKKAYRFTLILMVVCAILSGISVGSSAKPVIGCLCFFRFWLGFAVGGVYPLSATIMSESANKKTRGAFIAAVFAMQGMGIIFAGLVPMFLSKIFLYKYHANAFMDDPVHFMRTQANLLWRIVLMLGAFPAGLTLYCLTKMPETGRYTALIEGKPRQAAIDMARVLNIEIEEEGDMDKISQFKEANDFCLFSDEFFRRHGLHLIGTMSTWFMLDIAYFSQNLLQNDIYQAMGLVKKDYHFNAIQEVYDYSFAMFAVALLGTFLGYWFTVILIETLGRFTIQLIGFSMMSVFMLIMGVQYGYLRDHNKRLFALLYGLTFFFANCGPNSTTFVLPSELFPSRMRSTCHALSAAAGKAGAIIGTFIIQSYTSENNVNTIKHALMVLAFTNMLGFCCTFCLRETKGRSLEDISSEDGGEGQTIMLQEIRVN